MNTSCELSIITPTYNRKKELSRVYYSILQNVSKNFVWIIVDDGSTDGTEEVVKSWINKNRIKIHYIKQKNGGVSKARQTGNQSCETKWMTWIDSDDYYKEHAIDIIFRCLNKFESVICNNKCAGLMFPFEIDGKANIVKGMHSLTEMYYRFGLTGEFVQIIKTNVRNRFSDPFFEGEKFVSESAHLRKIDRYYKFLCIERPIAEREYETAGLTHNINFVLNKNPYGQAYTLKVDSAYGKDMGIMKQAQAYTDYWAYLKNRLNYTDDIFPEISVSPAVKIISTAFYDVRSPLTLLRCMIMYPFPITRIKRTDKVIIYGAGNMGKAYMNQIKFLSLCEVVLWVDLMYENKRGEGLNVESIDRIYEISDFDRIIVAVKSKEEKKKIVKDLVYYGINSEIIV